MELPDIDGTFSNHQADEEQKEILELKQDILDLVETTTTETVYIEEKYGCPEFLLAANPTSQKWIDFILQRTVRISTKFENFRLMAIDIHQTLQPL